MDLTVESQQQFPQYSFQNIFERPIPTIPAVQRAESTDGFRPQAFQQIAQYVPDYGVPAPTAAFTVAQADIEMVDVSEMDIMSLEYELKQHQIEATKLKLAMLRAR